METKKKANSDSSSSKADIRHDMKNKLAVIKGYTELLLTKIKTEKESTWAKEILAECEEMRKMIDDCVR